MNFYAVLGVAESADAETIKQAYRKLANQCHPDTHPGDRKAEERFQKVSEAYSVLGDENKRREYDKKTAAGMKQERKGTAGHNQNRPPFRADSSSKGKNPIDTSAIFEKYMGFR